MESTLFKNTTLKVSGVLNGPVTLVYGIGGIVLIVANKYLINKIKVNKILEIIISFFIYIVILTLVEFVCGYLCNVIFDVDMWNYTSKKYNFGKYICLEYMPIWGFLGLLITYIFKPFFDKVIKLIPKEATYFFTLIIFLDIIITLITK
ncbi:MAG: putative ABC transporter permease [Bacilli bacterium]|nr:putative ABC transporter permease [Bacilli bacterium]